MRTVTNNPAAYDQAAWHVSHYGSADAALKVVDNSGYNDAFDRQVCQELRAMQTAEWEAARIAVVQKASLYLAAA